MTKEELQEGYKSLILPENKAPYHFEQMEGGETVEAYNPICGDKYKLYLKGDTLLDEIHFHGIGCAVSKASTSLLLRGIEGRPRDEIIDFCVEFISAVRSGEAPSHFSGGLQMLIQLKAFDGRVDCIQLGWKALLAHLENSQ